MGDDENIIDLNFAPCQNIILESSVFYKLQMDFRRVFDLIKIIAVVCFPEDIYSAVIVIV